MKQNESNRQAEGGRKKIRSVKPKNRDRNFWTVFSIKAYGNDFDFYYAENLKGNKQSTSVFLKMPVGSETITSEQS